MFYLCETGAAATNVLSVRNRSGSHKAPITTPRYGDEQKKLN